MQSAVVRSLVLCPCDLLLRHAALVAQTASRFDSDITVECRGRTADGKGILGLAALMVGRGCRVQVEARGDDAAPAIRILEALFQNEIALEVKRCGESGKELAWQDPARSLKPEGPSLFIQSSLQGAMKKWARSSISYGPPIAPHDRVALTGKPPGRRSPAP